MSVTWRLGCEPAKVAGRETVDGSGRLWRVRGAARSTS
jgi:hypothetical protein